MKRVKLENMLLVHSFPAIVGGGVFHLVNLAFVAFFSTKLANREVWAKLAIISLIACIPLIQLLMSQSGYIIGPVALAKYRETLSIGTYDFGGTVRFTAYIKFIFNIVTLTFITHGLRFIGKSRFNLLISRVLFLLIFTQILMGIMIMLLSKPFITELVFPIKGASPNFLVRDQFGYRNSGFFYEPSHLSMLVSTITAIWLNSFSLKKMALAIGCIVFTFFTTRSATGPALFILLVFLIRAPRPALVVAFLCLFCFPLVSKFIASEFGGLFFLRSIFERFYFPQVNISNVFGFITGFDFGQVYAFIPIYGIAMQIGVLGLVMFLVFFGINIRIFLIFLVLCTVSPQLWFSIQWSALAFLWADNYLTDRQCK
ncbi:hypothetical protein [Maritalea mediterranea]|uniref:Polymerase n=1 Tax=Maritalea mediterranea TaxID=2909667 RepID=A0ABS9E6B3_9HYPH|nr:hypothetical protein [Maritalea mediterranea]MCF4098408.1 hypothetical protein [Maritalea mediterranea]